MIEVKIPKEKSPIELDLTMLLQSNWVALGIASNEPLDKEEVNEKIKEATPDILKLGARELLSRFDDRLPTADEADVLSTLINIIEKPAPSNSVADLILDIILGRTSSMDFRNN